MQIQFFCISAEVPGIMEEINLLLFSNTYIANGQWHRRANYPFFTLDRLALIVI